jgi:3-deoxy-D-manno-octulosonic-acid transferase
MIRDMPLLCMQSEADRTRIVNLGADPSRVVCTGNLKFDQYLQQEMESPRLELLRELMIPDGVPLFVAGSTHRGEEESALEAFRRAKREVSDLLLLLAPRHPERLGEVERLLSQRGLTYSRRSAIGPGRKRAGEVILLDTVGELGKIYSLATVVFVGGSLAPVGGHNILEPALYGRPILFGPHMRNFQEIAELFLAGGGALSVRDAGDLGEKLLRLLHRPQEAEAMGEKARSLLGQHRGATERTWNLAKDHL